MILKEASIPERIYAFGSNRMSDIEILMMLIGGPKEKARQTAIKLREKFKNISGIKAASQLQLQDYLSLIQIARLQAAFELGRRADVETLSYKKEVKSADDACNVLRPLIGHLKHEECWVLILNKAMRLIDCVQVSKGGRAGTVVDPKLVFTEALKADAAAIIIAHNHPSGNKLPSQADREVTTKLHKAGDAMDLPLLDHLIITANDYYSFADAGCLSK